MHHCVPSHFNWTSFSTTCGHLKEFFFLSSTALKSRIMLLSSTNTTPNSLVPFFLITVEEHVSFRILTLFPVVLLCQPCTLVTGRAVFNCLILSCVKNQILFLTARLSVLSKPYLRASRHKLFCGVRWVFLRPAPKLEDQGIPVHLGHHLLPVQHGRPCQ